MLTASFPIADLQREDSAASTRFEVVVSELRGPGLRRPLDGCQPARAWRMAACARRRVRKLFRCESRSTSSAPDARVCRRTSHSLLTTRRVERWPRAPRQARGVLSSRKDEAEAMPRQRPADQKMSAILDALRRGRSRRTARPNPTRAHTDAVLQTMGYRSERPRTRANHHKRVLGYVAVAGALAAALWSAARYFDSRL